jgi:hypothetical protein
MSKLQTGSAPKGEKLSDQESLVLLFAKINDFSIELGSLQVEKFT